ncbi:hypothetical protein ACOMHN_038838 [Nucella lapillus]
MSTDPVISSRYGVRPLLDLPALEVNPGAAPWKPSHLSTMIPPQHHRPNPPEMQAQASVFPGQAVPGRAVQGQAVPDPVVPSPVVQVPPLPILPRLQLPMDWPLAAGLPGSLFAAPPGPLIYKDPQMFPYSFLHQAPFTRQPPPFQFTDSSGQPVQQPNLSLEQQNLSLLYPGVHDPCLPPGLKAPGGLTLPGLVPQQNLQQPQRVEAQAEDEGHVHFEGVLTFGQLSTDHSQEKTEVFNTLPEFLRLELESTYGHLPATDIRIMERNGEFHVYASPRRTEGDMTSRDLDPCDRRMIV